jgi:hypothetical protein
MFLPVASQVPRTRAAMLGGCAPTVGSDNGETERAPMRGTWPM